MRRTRCFLLPGQIVLVVSIALIAGCKKEPKVSPADTSALTSHDASEVEQSFARDVAYWLMQKSKREIYTDPVVKYGFARGIEPVTYVAVILDRYDHYRQYFTNAKADEGKR